MSINYAAASDKLTEKPTLTTDQLRTNQPKTGQQTSNQYISNQKNQSPAQALVNFFGDLESLQADFEQLRLDAGGKNLQAFTGKLLLQKPFNFYYETNPPHNQVIALKDNEIWIYDKDLEQVTVQKFNPQDPQLNKTPLMLVMQSTVASLEQNFTIKASKPGKSGQRQFELIPLAKDQLYEKIRFHFSRNTLYEIQLEDSIGQKTVITLEDPVYNQPIDAKDFQLELPDKIDILR